MLRPNVLLISVDQWPGHLLGVTGHPSIHTPTLDELARTGRRFTNAHAECPICVPARRSLMLGRSPRAHGDRIYDDLLEMPKDTLAASFSSAGYQTYAVGKLHVWPQRDRIGFDDVMLEEEGRAQYGAMDDYEMHLGDEGYPGQQFDHGMSTDGYVHRAWHLPERLHVTNWATQAMIRQIKRRDPTRPAFWYLSYRHPHPPLVPPQAYVDLYDRIEIDRPIESDWQRDAAPWAVRTRQQRGEKYSAHQVLEIRRHFYALCTQIDHQLRLVVGTLREEMLLNDTLILFLSDHGDTLGDHGLWAKSTFYRAATGIPMILVPPANHPLGQPGETDDRLMGLADVMPTLLEFAGIDAPEGCDGRSAIGPERREHLYGEAGEGARATRMLRTERHKLIYYPTGNRRQLFDMVADPEERHDLAADPAVSDVLEDLTRALIEYLHGSDLEWIADGQLVGFPDREMEPRINRDLSSQRGHHWPPQLHSNLRQIINSA